MKKNIYVKPSIAIMKVGTENQLMVTSISDRTGLDNAYGNGGQSNGSIEINAKNNKYSIWGYDDED